MYHRKDYGYSDVIDKITKQFGHSFNRDVIITIVESCGGDETLSVDALMKLSDSHNMENKQDNISTMNNPTTAGTYAAAALKPSEASVELYTKKEAPSKQAIKKVAIPKLHFFWTDAVHRIIDYFTKSVKVMIIMRGAPGSGKSTLARQIVEMTVGPNYNNKNAQIRIFSTDDFFMVGGKYIFNKSKLCDAHRWNQDRVLKAAKEGLNTIIVDNTNIEMWEIEPYVRIAVNKGYILEVVEPTTPWAWKASELAKRNIHYVPIMPIIRMLKNYRHNITPQQLIDANAIRYPQDKVPVLKKVTDLNSEVPKTPNELKGLDVNINPMEDDKKPEPVSKNCYETSSIIPQPCCSKARNLIVQETNGEKVTDTLSVVKEGKNILDCEESENNDEKIILKDKFLSEAQIKLEKLQKEEIKWESNGSWSSDTPEIVNKTTLNKTTSSIQPKRSQRKIDNEPVLTEKLKDSINNCNDWSDISMFMSPWNKAEKPIKNILDYKDTPEKVSSSTCMEMGDTDINNGNLKIISTTPRDINKFHIAFDAEKIPHKRMLDKSSMTKGNIIVKSRYQNFSNFKELFPEVAINDLRVIFDTCQGNVKWAAEIVNESVANKMLHTPENEDSSDTENNDYNKCVSPVTCQNIPDGPIPNTLNSNLENIDETNVPGCSKDVMPQTRKKIKKYMSHSSILLKSQIEKNVFISEDHYSEHCLKIKKMRHGEIVKYEHNSDNSSSSDNPYNAYIPELNENIKADQSDDDSSSTSMDEAEKIVPVNLGMDCVKILDNLFGRSDMIYPPNVKPIFNVRSSLLNELNAVWIESLMHQLEDENLGAVKKDEEFARELASKEAELLQAGKEPAVPDLKEIMDMEFALNLYKKNVDEWKNQQPNDYAAKMTREKLCNLFPDVAQDTLLELLMAHNNNFEATVQVLLISTGRNDILNAPNGVNKFIMEKELERQEKILEQEKKVLSEAEWPLLMKDGPVDMNTVKKYRDLADQYLQRKTEMITKARDSLMLGAIPLATFYAGVASFHRRKHEHASSKAALSLIQINSANNRDAATIDLHYLHVPEAMESLDIFLDSHIQHLRKLQARYGSTGGHTVTLFIITGRGLHSPGGPRIKPAVIKRLKERRLMSTEGNPGLLKTKVTAYNLMSHQLRKVKS